MKSSWPISLKSSTVIAVRATAEAKDTAMAVRVPAASTAADLRAVAASAAVHAANRRVCMP